MPLTSPSLEAPLSPFAFRADAKGALKHLPSNEGYWLRPDGTFHASAPGALALLVTWSASAHALRAAAGVAHAHDVPLVAVCQDEVAAEAYHSGADHVVSPEGTVHDCLVRARAFSRRFREGAGSARVVGTTLQPLVDVLSCGTLRLERRQKTGAVGSLPLSLSPKEFALLWCLLEDAGTPVPRARLLKEVWGLDFDPGTNRLEFFVHRLRARLRSHGLHGRIHAVRGVGYALMPSS